MASLLFAGWFASVWVAGQLAPDGERAPSSPQPDIDTRAASSFCSALPGAFTALASCAVVAAVLPFGVIPLAGTCVGCLAGVSAAGVGWLVAVLVERRAPSAIAMMIAGSFAATLPVVFASAVAFAGVAVWAGLVVGGINGPFTYQQATVVLRVAYGVLLAAGGTALLSLLAGPFLGGAAVAGASFVPARRRVET